MKKLGELFEFVNGRGFKKTEWKTNGLPIIRIQNLNNATIRFNFYQGDYDKKIEINSGDLLFSWSGTIGSSFGPHIWKGEKGLLNQHIFKLVFKENIYRDYAYYGLKQITGDIEKKVNGAVGLVHITKGKLNQFTIPFPPLPEQKRIVAVLDKAFSAIAKAKANAEQNLINAKELFENYLLTILLDKKWTRKTLSEVCNKVEYGSSSKSNPDGKIPVLRMGNIQNGRFNWDKLVYSDNEDDNQQYLLKYNDVLFNRTNSPKLVGKTAIYKGEMPAIFAGYLIRIHRKLDLLDADFLNYYLNSEMAMDYGKTVMISSVNQANINGTKLKGYPIPCPTLEEQQAIVQKLDTLSAETNKLETIYQQKIDDLEELKKSVLQKAFNGELTDKEVDV
jgi:type I restriction enzyme, S subunit